MYVCNKAICQTKIHNRVGFVKTSRTLHLISGLFRLIISLTGDDFVNIKGIAHLAFRVRDEEASLKFYCDVLGFKKKFVLEDERWNLLIIYIEVTPNQFIELFPTKEEFSEINDRPYQHLCLEVEDLKALIDDLKYKNIEIDQDISMGLDNNYQAWIHDPDGNPIELMQYGVGSLQLK